MHKFLTCYDYGTGGVWRYIVADSVHQILTKYPELVVVDSIPEWMNQDIINRINDLTVNIKDNKDDFLNVIVADRNKVLPIDSVVLKTPNKAFKQDK